ncbi:MAG TPA: proprotein convertase P-domain-containing protein, partial [Thermoanaerobaculia bacterium]|nr:proprotein convertase P-domain-containing protein [Thermoanaerobaculia bacterium]HUM31313.1 proprotein convertase P-domain-containing protein [Thermoanaerobaculia bacterium]HXK69667.1 proprotein convertase P-domain-containing protein [Thermoanaerobaculia bacterium]
MRRRLWSMFALVLLGSCSLFANRQLTFEERVEAQRAIERVYYNHRIWPDQNRRERPSFEETVPDGILMEKVDFFLGVTEALRQGWDIDITPEQIQAEMDRIAAETKDPDMLLELYGALGCNPDLIAECLIRPILAERLGRDRYAYDLRIHEELRSQVEEIRKTLTPETFRNAPAGAYHREQLDVSNPATRNISNKGHDLLEPSYMIYPEVQGVIVLEETRDAFILKQTVRGAAGELHGELLVFPKTPFELWVQSDYIGPGLFLQAPNPIGWGYRLSLPGLSGSYRPDRWVTESYVPSPRYRHSAVWTGREMIIWGGSYTNTGGRYNPTLDSWTSTSIDGAPEERSGHTAIWTGKEMIVWGGTGGPGGELNTGGRYNPDTDQWTPLSPPAWVVKREFHTAVWTGEAMLVWGGRWTDDIGIHPVNSGFAYYPSTDNWIAMSTVDAPAERYSHTAVWTGLYMIIWGGRGAGYLNTGGMYNIQDDNWTPTPTLGAPSARYDHVAVYTGHEMVIWGGYAFGNFPTLGARLDPDTEVWTDLPEIDVPAGRFRASAVWTGESMIVWGGNGCLDPPTCSSVGSLSSGGRLKPGTRDWSWTPLISTGAPMGRYWHSAIWTGTEMIVWGGLNYETVSYPEQGGRYDPVLDAWRPTAFNAHVPTARSTHSTVWTGTEMIIWGGTLSDSSGGRYLPSLDAWFTTSQDNAPQPRRQHGAVWTGEIMLIWGGEAGLVYDLDGGKYNPVSDVWAPMSISGTPPQGRARHTTLWTGSEMLVWGGYYYRYDDVLEEYLWTDRGDGGRYHLSTDTWYSISTDPPCPSPRTFHADTWTGEEMIIWGGCLDLELGGGIYSYTVLGDGAKYDPDSDAWTTMSIVGAPEAREIPAATWTGSDFFIWGGDITNSEGSEITIYDNGGRYRPSTDEWYLIPSLTPAPERRNMATATWTGREVIVFGGTNWDTVNNVKYPRDGGRYTYTPANPADPGSWEIMPVEGQPAGRSNHSAIWSGNAFIVWGGGPQRSLGILSPNTNPISSPMMENPGNTVVIGGLEDLHLNHALLPSWRDNVEIGEQWIPDDSEDGWHRVQSQMCTGAGDYASPFHAWYAGESSTCTYDGTGGADLKSLLLSASTHILRAGSLLTFRYVLGLDQDQVFSATDTPLSIQDAPWGEIASSSIRVMNSGVVNDLNIIVNITHPFVSDLNLVLESPQGTMIVLSDRNGGIGADYTATLFDDSGAVPIASGVAPFTGSFIPEEPLAGFTGEPVEGYWTLHVLDTVTGNIGRIQSWSLILTTAGENGDTARVEISDDGGGTWTVVAEDVHHWLSTHHGMSLNDDGSSWHAASIDVGRILGITEIESRNVLVRFALERDGVGDTGIGWILDDIGIGEPSGDGDRMDSTVTAPNGSAARPSVPFHDLWDEARFEWDLNGDGIGDNADITTPKWDIPPGDLGNYGLGQPDTYTVYLKVTDITGLSSTTSIDVHVIDGVFPLSTVFMPNGGESWAYSGDAGKRKSHLIVWQASDNFPPMKRTKLSYSSDEGASWTCIADSCTDPGECPDTCGNDQNYSGSDTLLAWDQSFLWDMPTQEEAASSSPAQVFPSSAARVKVDVWDESGNHASDTSDA